MVKSHIAPALFLLAAVALAAACTPDRFTDSGCEVDADCRGERMCVEGRCVGDDPTSADAGDEDADVDESDSDTPDEDVEMLDIGSEEDADVVDLEAFVGQWELEGPIDVLDEEGNVVQELQPQLFLTRIEDDGEMELAVDVQEIPECDFFAVVIDAGQFELQPSECRSNPVEDAGGAAAVTGGTGRLSVNQTILELDFTIEVDSEQLGGVLFLDFDLAGPRTEF